MANGTAYVPIDMQAMTVSSGTVTDFTDTHIRIVNGDQAFDYYGYGFAHDTSGNLIAGTLTGMDRSYAGNLEFRVTGLNHSIVTFNSYLLASDMQGALAFMFNGNDAFVGSSGADVAMAYAGNDTLNGGAGADTAIGGPGNDVYVLSGPGDVVVEQPNEGIDTVKSPLSYVLGANLEKLTLTGTSAINGTGNGLANVISGNGAGNVLTGSAGNDTLSGWGGNDTLNGGTGADSLAGGTGNDTYALDNALDIVREYAAAGTDLVRSSISHTLGANLENLTLTGTAPINGTGNALANVIAGNGVANLLTGSAGDDTLSGWGGNDTLNGGTGADSLAGGTGNDTYAVDSALDIVREYAAAGTDLVRSSVNHTLGANVEKLALTGIAAINGTGNSLANVIIGNGAANLLKGAAGNDQISGGAGTDSVLGGTGNDTLIGAGDVLTGGLDADTFVFSGTATGTNANRITDFAGGSDRIELSATSFAAIGPSGQLTSGDERFYAAAGATTGHDTTDRLIYNTSTGRLFYDADGSEAGASVMLFSFTGIPAISETDIYVA